jgi:hypothetical protein
VRAVLCVFLDESIFTAVEETLVNKMRFVVNNNKIAVVIAISEAPLFEKTNLNMLPGIINNIITMPITSYLTL